MLRQHWPACLHVHMAFHAGLGLAVASRWCFVQLAAQLVGPDTRSMFGILGVIAPGERRDNTQARPGYICGRSLAAQGRMSWGTDCIAGLGRAPILQAGCPDE
ncbi:hypothetical protein K491DRAFT_198766 [Lophiostoma macrostomum CBS 122681]|uniref:Uncharacterized protein n=1 Tax=Lophiostoma macrostomum CBS 122681 TaxID=1314788 RepID=A0A6A6SNW1_9PLEO|nr:hypothetical protein K491DRAFT_198766 [Lophiostoma macrostomum CBS 122681]